MHSIAATESPDSFPSKDVILGGYRLKLHGIAANDGYWCSINDEYDPNFTALCRRLILRDYICLDVGANIGVKSSFLSRHSRDGQIVAIEAGPTIAQCLAVNVAANGAANVHIERTAAGDCQGSIHFDERSAWGKTWPDGIEVPVTTLEEIGHRLNLPRVDFIKIDTEGSELGILKSSLDLINRHESLVLVEFNAWTQIAYGSVNPREFIEWVMANFRYVFEVRGSGDLMTELAKGDWHSFLYRNLVEEGCRVTDLLLTNSERRLSPSPIYLEQQLAEGIGRLSAMTAERDALLGRLSAMTAERDALLGSNSWRVTAPLRWLKQRRRS